MNYSTWLVIEFSTQKSKRLLNNTTIIPLQTSKNGDFWHPLACNDDDGGDGAQL